MAYRHGEGEDADESELHVIDPVSLESRLTFKTRQEDFEGFHVRSFTPDGKLMVGTAGYYLQKEPKLVWENEMVWWDARSGREKNRLLVGRNIYLAQECHSQDSKWMAVANSRAPQLELYMFRHTDQTLQHTIPLEQAEEASTPFAQRPVFSPDGEHVIVVVNDAPKGANDRMDPSKYPRPRIYVISVEQGKIIKTFLAPRGWAISPQFSPDGKSFVISGHRKVMFCDWEAMRKEFN